MNISQTLKIGGEKLQSAGIAEASLEAQILLGHALHQDRAYLLAHPEKNISVWRNVLFNRMINRRIAGYSSAAVIGHKWFYGLDFLVDRNTLIPRPETELLVEKVLEFIENGKVKFRNIVDVGTGSGNIIISLAEKSGISEINFWGVDISRPALRIARKNAARLGLKERIFFLHSDLLNSVNNSIFQYPLLITANLPYLTAKQIHDSPTIGKEPQSALLSGLDGLDHYRRLFGQVIERTKSFLAGTIICCEIDETQKEKMEGLIKQSFPQAKFDFQKDLNGVDRLVIIRL